MEALQIFDGERVEFRKFLIGRISILDLLDFFLFAEHEMSVDDIAHIVER